MIGNKLEPFKFWCQKVLPNVYDDSLSYYEYLCKLNEYLNEVIGQINTLTDNMEDYEADLTATWLETKEYIDNYFNNLDVQQEINNKLDQMTQSGTLSTLIAPFVSQEIGGVVASQIGNTVASQIGGTVANQIGAVVAEQIDEPTATATNAWLTAHVDPIGSAVIVNNSLTVSGAAADAKVVGDKILASNVVDLLDSVELNSENVINGYYTVSGTHNENPTFNTVFIPVEPNDVLYCTVGVTLFIDCGCFDENKDWVAYIKAENFENDFCKIVIPDNNSIKYLGLTHYAGYLPFLTVSETKIPMTYNKLTKSVMDRNDVSIYDYLVKNKVSNDPDFFAIAKTTLGYGGDVCYIQGSYDNKTLDNSWAYLLFNTREITTNNYGLIAVAHNSDYVICVQLTDSGYNIFTINKILSTSITRLEQASDTHTTLDLIQSARKLHLTNDNGILYIYECNEGINIVVDYSKYVDDTYKIELGAVYMEIADQTHNYYRGKHVIYPNPVVTNPKMLQNNVNNALWKSSKFSITQRTLGLRMLCDVNGFYYVPFNAIGMGRTRGNGLYGNDYVSDQIHPTELGGYNVAIAVWSYLKNIPNWYTSIPITNQPLDGTQWSGKTWYAYGTSLTQESSGKWVNKVASLSGMTAVNRGIGGGALVTNRQLYDRLMDMTDGKLNADLITIEVGANDSSYIGEPWSLDNNTFLGALNYCLKAMLEGGVKAQIVIMNSYSSRYQYQHPENKYNVDWLTPVT